MLLLCAIIVLILNFDVLCSISVLLPKFFVLQLFDNGSDITALHPLFLLIKF